MIKIINKYINKTFCMDNLELLKQLPDNSTDLIYSDILYNTGKRFKDYEDKLGTPQEAMEFYRPRLIEMHRVLKDTGSIYLQCDYRLVHYLKVEMDKIFDYKNFRNDIKWRYSVNYKQNTYPHDTDNILYYTKSDKFTYNQQYKDSEATMKRMKNVLTKKDGKLYYYQGRFLKDSPYKNKLRSEKWVKENGLEEYFYEREYIGVRVSEMWDDIAFVARGNEGVGYDTQKPKALLERILLSSSNEGDIIADFFCGSGTTGIVAKELNRKYILCDINPRAIEISEKRLKEINT